MMKFFRKHNKKLLAVFGVLLMIVFVGGSALDNLLQPSSNRVAATSFVGNISYEDQRNADARTGTLARIGLNWEQPFGGMNTPLDITDWILLTREAKRLGVGTNPAAMRSSLGTHQDFLDLSRRLGAHPDHILAAMAEFDSVQRAARAVAGTVELSEAEVRLAARDTLEKVQVAVVTLPARAFVDDQETFTESEVEAQFSAFREREAGAGLRFGYYVRPVLRVQYIRVDKPVIAEALRGIKSRLMEKKAREYYDAHRETDRAFARPPDDAADRQSEEPVVGPPSPPPSPYLSWNEAREIATEKAGEEEATQATARIADWLIQHLGERWLDIPRDPKTGYRKAPDAAVRLEHYDEAVASLPKTIAYPAAILVATTGFFNTDDADDVPLLGAASFLAEGARMPVGLRDLAFQTEAIVPSITFDRDTDPMDYTATYQTCRYPLTDSDGNMYVFRVVASSPGHVPESVEEVRDRVTADLRLKHGYETAKARGESLSTCAGGVDLRAAYRNDETLVALEGAGSEIGISGLGLLEPPPFARANRYDVMSGERPKKTLIRGGLGPVSTEFVDRCFALEYAPERIVPIELEERATVLVVEWLDTLRTPYEQYATMREPFVREMTRARMQLAIRDWLDPEQIRARTGLRLAGE